MLSCQVLNVGALIIAAFFAWQISTYFISKHTLKRKLKVKHEQLRDNRKYIHDLVAQKLSKERSKPLPTNEIIRLPAHEISALVKKGVYTCSDVLTAFQQRCIHSEGYNFLAQYIHAAEEIAQDLDKRKDEFKHSPIYGVPVSMKECLSVKGHDSTCGLVKCCGSPRTSNSVIYDVLVHNGAIPFITTSMARAGMSHDSSNPIFGEQHNPNYAGYIAGGSSGGEGIALCMDASPLGVGSDIGGSVRFPPAFNGLCGLNPTRDRISDKGIFVPGDIPRLDLIITLGPMARYVHDLVAFFRAVLCDKMFELDPSLVPLKFDEARFNSTGPLKIAYYKSFETSQMTLTVPAVQRAVQITADSLEKQGHTVEEIEFPKAKHAFTIALKALLHDGGASLTKVLAAEPIPLRNEMTRLILKLPGHLRRIVSNAFYAKYGEPTKPLREALKGVPDAIEAAKLMREIEDYRDHFDKVTEKFDVILCPLFPIPIPKKGEDDTYNNTAACYSLVYNLLNRPAGVVCVDRVTLEDNAKALERAKDLRRVGDHYNAHFHETQTQASLPLCVQVVGRKYQEETVLRTMALIEAASNFDYRKISLRKNSY